MKIGFDAKRAFFNYTGLGNYSRLIIHALFNNYPEHQYFLFTPKTKRAINFLAEEQKEKLEIIKPEKRFGKILKSYWRSVLVTNRIAKLKLDIYHGLSNELPFNINEANTKSIVSIHDLIFLRFPEYYKAVDREIYDKKSRESCKNANKIIAVSEQTKKDIIEYYSVSEEKIKVIYQCCDPIFQTTPTEEQFNKVKEKYELPDQYILYVGTIEERKRLLNVVKSIYEGKIDTPLVVIGMPTKYLKKVVNYICHNLIENIIFLKNVPNEDLPAIYQMAQVFIYPSIFEGFGIPVLEAATSRVPVITSKGSCLEESGGPSSLYINPDDIEEMIFTINKVLESEELRKKMIKDGFEYSKKFSLDTISSQIIQTYRELLPNAK
ncbi:glycosyltransferase family 4 protein [Bacteroidota bacterium]